MKNNEVITNTVKYILKKLISEEFLAWQFYRSLLWSANFNISKKLEILFLDIANDELNDHLTKLVNYAKSYNINIPCTNEEYQKYANKKIVKQFLTKIKRNKDINFYIDEVILAEQEAILSYENAIKEEELPDDLYRLLLEIYYEEQDHLSDLNTLKYTVECEYGGFLVLK